MSNGEEGKATGVLLGLIGMLVGLLAGLFEAYVVTVLWGWFVVPIFAAPELPLLATYGMLALVGLVRHRYLRCEEKEQEGDRGRYVFGRSWTRCCTRW